MNNDQFKERLDALFQQISTLPENEKKQLHAMAQKTQQRHDTLTQKLTQMQDGLATLRVQIQYMALDLEATKRENRTLRDRLEKFGQDDLQV